MPRLRMGMIGGGLESLAGGLHRYAAALDGGIDFVAGALASSPERAQAAAQAFHVARSYASWQQMLEAEQSLPQSERIDFIVIATPNHLHFPIAKACLAADFDVVCDKPLTHALSEAKELAQLAAERNGVFALTHNYTGYPMAKQARHMIAAGELGDILKVTVEYHQGWLLQRLEHEGNRQAAWRTDPQRSGRGGALADIGTHAELQMRYMTGLRIESLCADLGRQHGRALDDDASILLYLDGGARGVLTASQVLNGEENDLNVRIYGSRGSLTWKQQEPETLTLRRNDQPIQILRKGEPYLCEAAKRATRLPPGHPEAFIEAFANVYLNATGAIRARKAGRAATALESDFPTAEDGLLGMAFIEAAVDSDAGSAKWTAMAPYLQ